VRVCLTSGLCRLRRAYTLIEVLAAAAIVAVGMTAAVSLASSMMLQEEMSWRVAVTRNYQENMARLWQLGLSPADVVSLMPAQTASPLLNQIISGTPYVVEIGTANPGGLGTMQAAAVTAAVNISQNPSVKSQGAPLTLSVYRASLPNTLRPPPP
jgi:prepilin-type N-terminal cleavage/methylation domain-containing protein